MTQRYPRLKRDIRRKYRSSLSAFKPSLNASVGPWIESKNSVSWADQVTLGKGAAGWKHYIAIAHSATTSLEGYSQIHNNRGLRYEHVGTLSSYGDSRFTVGVNLNAGSEVSYPSTAVSAYAEYKAAQALLGSYISAQNSWRGGNFIAEFAETVRFLARPAKAIYHHTYEFVGRVGKLKKVYRRDPVRYGKLLGGVWLSYAFGLKPMIGDAIEANNAINNLRESLGAFDTLPIKGFGYEESAVHTVVNGSVPNCPYAKYSADTVTRAEVKYYGKIRAAPTGWPQIAEDFGVGFTDIVPAVWEAIPWSWLVDYFLNVGEVLDSAKLAFADLAWLNRGRRTTFVTSSSDIYDDKFGTRFGYRVNASGGRALSARIYKSRARVDEIPYPGFRFRIPGIESTKWCNVTALTAAIAGSRPLK